MIVAGPCKCVLFQRVPILMVAMVLLNSGKTAVQLFGIQHYIPRRVSNGLEVQ